MKKSSTPSTEARTQPRTCTTTPSKPRVRNPYLKTPSGTSYPISQSCTSTPVSAQASTSTPVTTPVFNPYAKSTSYTSRKAVSRYEHSYGSTKRSCEFDFSLERDEKDAEEAPNKKMSPVRPLKSNRASTVIDLSGDESCNPPFAAPIIDKNKSYTLYFDGGSRGNPGVSGAGMVIYDEANNEIWNGKQCLGDDKTNNAAEYYGLVTGLECAVRLGIERICVKGDSELVVKQLTGVYQCKKQHLQKMLQRALNFKQQFTKFEIVHVKREENTRADALANAAMNDRITDLGSVDISCCAALFSLSQDTTEQSTNFQSSDSFDDDILENELSFMDMPPSAQKVFFTAINSSEAQVCINLEQTNTFDDDSVEDELRSLEIPEFSQASNQDETSWLSSLSFLARFEIERFGLQNSESLRDAVSGVDNLNELIAAIYKEVNSPDTDSLSPPPYEHFLKHCLDDGIKVDEGTSCMFLFQTRLTQNGIEHLPPEPADVTSKRIHRRFGSHRFLEMTLEKKCDEKALRGCMKRFFTKDNKLIVAGRQYAILYSIPSEMPVTFRLFAESGTGIESSDEMTASHIASMCIPPSLNPGLSVTKYMKRMQLSFTTTMPSLVLEQDELECIPDINGDNGCIMTDGCGLISRKALNKCWTEYMRNIEGRRRTLGKDVKVRDIMYSAPCPHSSFQARVGGIKGMFVVDDSVEGVKLKYNTPITSGGNHIDAMHKTVEIMEWDKINPPHAHLNTGFIQLLEERGVRQDFFLSLAQKEIDELNVVSTDYNLLTKKYKARRLLTESQSSLDDDILWRMMGARVPLDEPTMLFKVNGFINDELTVFKEKSKFPVLESRYLRMLPDHTGLLLSDEAFIAVGDEKAHSEIHGLGEIVAARNPSYFASDIRKLRVVSQAELIRRDPLKGIFFSGIAAGLVLSTNGNRSTAEMMSGGDFDGDKAWCCWNEHIVNGTKECQEYDRPAGLSVDPWKDTTIMLHKSGFTDQIISYTMHHKQDKYVLGRIANNLEVIRDNTRFSTQDRISVARKAFVQVDNPHVPQWTTNDDALYGQIGRPHWKVGREASAINSYRSIKALGKLFDLLNAVGKKDFDYEAIEPEMNAYIRKRIERASEKDPEWVRDIREEMLAHLTSFNQSLATIYKQYKDKDATTQRLKKKAVTDLCGRHRDEIIKSHADDDVLDVMAILYEQTYFRQRVKMQSWRQGPYIFAWEIGQAYLTRIIADGSSPGGIAVTIARGHPVIFRN